MLSPFVNGNVQCLQNKWCNISSHTQLHYHCSCGLMNRVPPSQGGDCRVNSPIECFVFIGVLKHQDNISFSSSTSGIIAMGESIHCLQNNRICTATTTLTKRMGSSARSLPFPKWPTIEQPIKDMHCPLQICLTGNMCHVDMLFRGGMAQWQRV